LILNSQRITKAKKAILAGLYLSKYDSLGLRSLGFQSFSEAFNVLGYAVGAPPGSIKNYRDEFDPMFENARKGWHKRPRRDNCIEVYEEYKNLAPDLFTGLIKSLAGYDENAWSEFQTEGGQEDETSFAKRLITGLAAEQYFEMNHHTLAEFRGCIVQNTTRMGCGYDFRLQNTDTDDFLVVEVKGLKTRTGGLSLTRKEHAAAVELKDRFYLFVVKNFQESPFHEIFRDPLSGDLEFKRSTRTVLQVSWLATV
jgi:hypothetical protein